MAHQEKEMATIPCRVCGGDGRCEHCNNDPVKKRECVRCFYSGRCQTCGGSGKEIVSRRF